MNKRIRFPGSIRGTLALIMPALNLLAATAWLAGIVTAAPAGPDKPAGSDRRGPARCGTAHFVSRA